MRPGSVTRPARRAARTIGDGAGELSPRTSGRNTPEPTCRTTWPAGSASAAHAVARNGTPASSAATRPYGRSASGRPATVPVRSPQRPRTLPERGTATRGTPAPPTSDSPTAGRDERPAARPPAPRDGRREHAVEPGLGVLRGAHQRRLALRPVPCEPRRERHGPAAQRVVRRRALEHIAERRAREVGARERALGKHGRAQVLARVEPGRAHLADAAATARPRPVPPVAPARHV